MSTEQNILENLQKTKTASYALQELSEAQIKAVLQDFSQNLRDNAPVILEANKKDLTKMDQNDPLYDRLLLNEDRIEGIACDTTEVAGLPSPVGEEIEHRTLDNGLDLTRIRVPLGVVGAIYEARPNVTPDVFALCFRSQNACILRGGTAAHETNIILIDLIQKTLKQHNIDPAIVYLMPPEREFVPIMLTAYGLVDVIIPRGSQGLIDFVRENASIPVIETGRGVVHTYIDESADIAMAAKIIENAKTRRPSVCNALDTLLIHEALLPQLKTLVHPLAGQGVKIYANDKAKAALATFYPSDLSTDATDETKDAEWMSLQMNLLAVTTMDEALSHIRTHGSGHTEAIIAQDKNLQERFLRTVDASTVMLNTSTAFTDGAQFGLGAEIGISTQKLHARGPMGLEALTSYKWLLRGDGQVRPT